MISCNLPFCGVLEVTPSFSLHGWSIDLGRRLAALRKQRTMAHQALADTVSWLPPEVQSIEKEMLERLVIKFRIRRWDKVRAVVVAPAKRVACTGGQS